MDSSDPRRNVVDSRKKSLSRFYSIDEMRMHLRNIAATVAADKLTKGYTIFDVYILARQELIAEYEARNGP